MTTERRWQLRSETRLVTAKQVLMRDTDPPITHITVRCACCGKKLGVATNEGWSWYGTPARLVNRRRLIDRILADGTMDPGELPVAPPDDFRVRAVQRQIGEEDATLWEYPYTCDSDICMNGLGSDWEHVGGAQPFSLMPPGRPLS